MTFEHLALLAKIVKALEKLTNQVEKIAERLKKGDSL